MAEPTQAKSDNIFDQILSGALGALGIGLGISKLTERPTTKETRTVALPSSAEKTALATLEALHGAQLADVGLRRTIGPSGTVELVSTPTPRSPLDLQGERLGFRAGELLTGNRRLSPQGRQALIERLRGVATPGLNLGAINGGTFTGSGAGLELQPPSGSTRAGGANSGSSAVLPAISSAIGALPRIVNLLRDGGSSASTTTGQTAGSGVGTAAKVLGAGAGDTGSLLTGVDQALFGAPLSPEAVEALSDIAITNPQALAGFRELAADAAAGTGIFAGTGTGAASLLPGIDAALGLTAPVAAPSASALGLTAGFPELAAAAEAGTGIFAGTGAGVGAAAAEGGGFLSGLAGLINPITLPLALTGLGLGLAFSGPSRSETSQKRRTESVMEAERLANSIGFKVPKIERDALLQAGLNQAGIDSFNANASSFTDDTLVAQILQMLSKLKLEGATDERWIQDFERAVSGPAGRELANRGYDVEELLNRAGFDVSQSRQRAAVNIDRQRFNDIADSGAGNDLIKFALSIGPQRLAAIGYELVPDEESELGFRLHQLGKTFE